MSEKAVLFVLGMGRSGTSALTRTFSLCGAELPPTLLGAHGSNPTGHWEPLDAIALNDRFLSTLGSNWYDPTLRLQADMQLDERTSEAFIERIAAFVAACPDAPILAIKDPRISAFATLWFAGAQRAGRRSKAVLTIRHPGEVAASLAARDGLSFELACALWLKYNLLAERQSRGILRVVVDYAALLADWRTQVMRAGSALGLRFDLVRGAEVDAFLRPELHRQRRPPELDADRYPLLLRRVYAALQAAAADAPLDIEHFDALYAEYRDSERLFRVADDDFRLRFGPAATTVPAAPTTFDSRLEGVVRSANTLSADGHVCVDDVQIEGEPAGGPIVIGPQETLDLRGWGVDRRAGDIGRAVFAVSETALVRGEYGFARSDVAQTLQNVRFFPSGFRISIAAAELGPGPHTIDVRLLAADADSVYSAGAALPVWVRS